METLKNSLGPVDSLKMRVLKIKPSFPRNHKAIFLEKYPEYDSADGLDRYRNVINLKSADEDITKKLEKLFGTTPKKKSTKPKSKAKK